jgi:hypothetical protein
LGEGAEAIVSEISEAIGASWDELPLSSGALGDAVGLAESPHGRDLSQPRTDAGGQGDLGREKSKGVPEGEGIGHSGFE